MPFFATIAECDAKLGQWVTNPADGSSHECVVAVKRLAQAPKTSFWRRGQKVKGNSIAPGTAIATFPRVHANGHLEFKGHGAIFIRQTATSIWVYDQWGEHPPHPAKPFGKREIFFNCGGYVSNDAEAFYVIELVETPSTDPALCGPTSYAGG